MQDLKTQGDHYHEVGLRGKGENPGEHAVAVAVAGSAAAAALQLGKRLVDVMSENDYEVFEAELHLSWFR